MTFLFLKLFILAFFPTMSSPATSPPTRVPTLLQCPAGSYVSLGSCVACSAGSYQATIGQSSCVACSTGEKN